MCGCVCLWVCEGLNMSLRLYKMCVHFCIYAWECTSAAMFIHVCVRVCDFRYLFPRFKCVLTLLTER